MKSDNFAWGIKIWLLKTTIYNPDSILFAKYWKNIEQLLKILKNYWKNWKIVEKILKNIEKNIGNGGKIFVFEEEKNYILLKKLLKRMANLIES